MKMPPLCFREAWVGPSDQPIFRDFSWNVEPFQSWIITGENGSGKSAIAQALSGGLPVGSRSASSGAGNQLPDPASVALISFERQRDIVFDERYHDDGDFVEGGIDPGTSALDFILARKRGSQRATEPQRPERLTELVQRLGIEAVLGRGLKYLSTGEIRKVLLCRELLREPAWLVFDEPYEGLDSATRLVLAQELDRLVSLSLSHASATRVLIITDRYEHLPQGTTHVLYIEDRKVAFAGPRHEFEAPGIPPELRGLGREETESLGQALAETLEERVTASAPELPRGPTSVLVAMRNVTVTYAERRVLDRLNFEVAPGEHTLVRGPNGCGKTTLLNLINGDNPQVYANDVTICGMKRGSGESIWDIKKKLGQVSYALHVEYAYRCHSNLIECVLSGFYDSIGLYQEPGFAEIQAAERWLSVVGLLSKRAQPFTQLSYGEQRIALILRAVIKQPPLLILDEPCHGLDPRHRGEVLTIADYIGRHSDSTLLYVTHDPQEVLGCTRQILEFDPLSGWRLSRA
ncbi:MAG TPA: ATP-binding cassette domain-containing protein [Polyangiaceae bacterium]